MASDHPTPGPLATPAGLSLLREAIDVQRRQYGAQLRSLRAALPMFGPLATDEPVASDLRAILRDLQELAGPYA